MNGDTPTTGPGARVGRYRAHARPGRPRKVQLRYSELEYDTVARAAHDAGLTTSGYVADAALAAAQGLESPRPEPWRAALTELMAARTQVRRIGTNINQAARVLNTTGEPPPWLQRALKIADHAIARLDDAATAMAAQAREDHTKTRNSRRQEVASESGRPPGT